jgi:PHP family Zn ribbon phosphoesterase
MSDGIMIYFDENNVAHEYDDTYDVTIHCESEKEQDSLMEALRRTCEEKLVNYSYDGYADGHPVLDMAECPSCGEQFEDGDNIFQNANYCPKCGQKIKWEADDDRE